MVGSGCARTNEIATVSIEHQRRTRIQCATQRAHVYQCELHRGRAQGLGRRAEIKEELVTGVKLSESTASSNSGRKLGMQYTILVVSPHHTDASARLGKHHDLSALPCQPTSRPASR